MRLRQRGGELGLRCVQVRCKLAGDRVGICGQFLIANLECGRLHRAGGADVSPPRPGGAARVAHALELVTPLWLHPEARIRPVRDTRVVGFRLLGAEPGFLEQRGHDVPSVADDVHDGRQRVGERDDRRDVCELRRLFHRAHGAHQPDAAGDGEDLAETPSGLVRLEGRQLGNGSLHRRDLAEIHEAGDRPDRAREKRRSRTR